MSLSETGPGGSGSGGGIPGGKWTLSGIVSALSVSVLGYNFLENPEGFVVAALFNYTLGAVVNFAAEVGLILADLWRLTTRVFVDAGAAMLAPFGSAGDAVLALLAGLNSWLIGVTSFAGPAAPIVALVVWTVVVVGVVTVLERLISAVAPWT